uniref:Uncharacterized protein n=1 Tax=Sparus aurata TaxID=8175 RepID=A0A671W545_SPAAU
MKKTFVCDESMIITIPIGSLNDAREGQLMPDKFRCVYKDSHKVFALSGYYTIYNTVISWLYKGIKGLILTLLVVEKLMAVFLIYWLSKVVCRQSFNTLPIILLKKDE